MSELLQKFLKEDYVLEKTFVCSSFSNGSHIYFPKKFNNEMANKTVFMLTKGKNIIIVVDDRDV